MFDFITGSLPSLVERTLDEFDAMLELASEMFGAATRLILDGKAPGKDLEEQEARLKEHGCRILNMTLPPASASSGREILLSPLLLSVVRDVECCGALASRIAGMPALAGSPRSGSHHARLRTIRDRAHLLFPSTRTAFLLADAPRALLVMEEHLSLRRRSAVVIHSLASSAGPPANQALVLAKTARLMLRISRHLSNIAAHSTTPSVRMRYAHWNASLLFGGLGA